MSDAASRPGKIGWRQAWSGRYLSAPSVLILIAANLIPLYGVLHWGWDLYLLMTVYWMETGIIGLWTIPRMAITGKWVALVLVPFFVVHFGGFMAGHFVFLWALFAGGWADRVAGVGDFFRVIVFGAGLWIAFLALFVSHGASFYLNVLRPLLREDSDDAAARAGRPANPAPAQIADPRKVMMAPYGRIVVMHVTILGGAFLIQIFQTRVAAFVLLIALKVAFDIAAHVRKNFAPLAPTTQ
jgi:hypothetical protein